MGYIPLVTPRGVDYALYLKNFEKFAINNWVLEIVKL
jgi:hypothetical protein